MASAYQAAEWQALWAAVAGSAAALLGLVFVALSVNLRPIAASPAHRARARESLGLLLELVVLSILALIPGQGRRALGAELVAVGIVLVGLSVLLQGQTLRRMEPARRRRWFARNLVFNFGMLTVLAAGISLLVNGGGGLLWLVPTVLINFIWAPINAWSLMLSACHQGIQLPEESFGTVSEPMMSGAVRSAPGDDRH